MAVLGRGEPGFHVEVWPNRAPLAFNWAPEIVRGDAGVEGGPLRLTSPPVVPP